MFNLEMLDKAKSIVASGTPMMERVSNGLEVAGAVSDFASAAQQRQEEPQPQAQPRPPSQASANPSNAWQAKNQLEGSQAGKTLKTAASAVAAYFTGGLSGMAQSVGFSKLGEKNPQAAGLASIAAKVWGG